MDNPMGLNGRTALVTGASGGLGKHFATVLAAAGARVVLTARRMDPLKDLAEQLKQRGSDALAVELDVTDRIHVAAAFDAAEHQFGVVDIVINNAGIGIGGRLEEISDADWQQTLATNMTGVHQVAAEAARRLIAARTPGSIINIASILGLRVSPGNAAYNASKAAVIQLTKSQALEWARHDIRVNALCPGYFATEMNAGFLRSERGQAMLKRIPMRRIGRFEELDGPLLLFASTAGSFMTGSVLAVDGGHLCSSL